MDIDLHGRFCSAPFTLAEIHWAGDVFLCCPTWVGMRSIGNIFEQSADELWNSMAAQELRAGILDGSFRGCEKHICPLIVGNDLPQRTENDPASPFLTRGPARVKLCHDDTCNLTCPSCRTHKIVANRERQDRLDGMLHSFILPFLADTKSLCMSGDGDPFASRHYRDVLRLTADRPEMRIDLHTNAVLCDQRAWDDCRLAGRVDNLLISIDAATAETYAITRRGGDFQRLLRNLRFLAELRQAGEIKEIDIAFVVQTANYREMPAFVELGRELGVDRVSFSLIQHWGRAMSDEAFHDAQVWRADHPLRADLSQVLQHPSLRDPIVYIGNVA